MFDVRSFNFLMRICSQTRCRSCFDHRTSYTSSPKRPLNRMIPQQFKKFQIFSSAGTVHLREELKFFNIIFFKSPTLHGRSLVFELLVPMHLGWTTVCSLRGLDGEKIPVLLKKPRFPDFRGGETMKYAEIFQVKRNTWISPGFLALEWSILWLQQDKFFFMLDLFPQLASGILWSWKNRDWADKCPWWRHPELLEFSRNSPQETWIFQTHRNFPNNLESWMESEKIPMGPGVWASAHRILLRKRTIVIARCRQMLAVWYGKHPSRLGHRHLAKNIQRIFLRLQSPMIRGNGIFTYMNGWFFMIDRLVRNIPSSHGSVMGMNWMMLNLPFVYKKLIICGMFRGTLQWNPQTSGHCGRSILACIQELQKAFLGDCRPLLSPVTRHQMTKRAIEKSGKQHCSTSTTTYSTLILGTEKWFGGFSLMILEASYNQ